MCYTLNWWPEQTVLTSKGRMKTMRKHRYQASSVLNRTIRCCFLKSPYRCKRNRARKKTTTISMASAAPLILLLSPVQQKHLGNQAGERKDVMSKYPEAALKVKHDHVYCVTSTNSLQPSTECRSLTKAGVLWKTLLFFFSRAKQNECNRPVLDLRLYNCKRILPLHGVIKRHHYNLHFRRMNLSFLCLYLHMNF